ncbi:thioester domain-containing protein [Actinoplanes sp. LDG1-06]|uniref:Thioester domain-containing protein n=1 Tax=Paractinoplanes ovalisporus TaxID=2810368 RepID=A0ABS2AG72_9ACTN|nr:thioester domain-containing protein [Actinoplanes ovalisporus]MBM2618839.1 thioester domain-containing protein [Actinoplanes ovalisporus]
MRNRLWGRIIPMVVAGAGLLLGSALPATAAEDDELTATARPDGTSRTLMLGGKATTVRGLEMTVDGGQVVPAFSLSFRPAFTGEIDYSDATWAESGVGNISNVQWILEHGFPSGNRADLIAAAGVRVPPGVSKATVDQLLRLGTQAAVWHQTNNVTLNAWRAGAGLGAENQYAVIKKVYDYLTRVDIALFQPQRTVTIIEPGYADGPDLAVNGPGGLIKIEVEDGYAITDGRFEGGTWLVTQVRNGGGFLMASTERGVPAKVTATAPHAVTPGQVFVAEGGSAQPLTPAVAYGEPVSATFEKQYGVWSGPAPTPSPTAPAAGPTTPPTSSSPAAPATTAAGGEGGEGGEGGGLPVTGAPTGAALTGGAALLVAGAVLLFLVRRRRLSFSS